MKKGLIGALTFVITLLVILVGVAQTLPTEYNIQVVEVFQGTPETVYSKIGNLKQWPSWSPWKEEDPSMTFDFSKTKEMASAGDSFSWKSKQGPGSIEITEANTNSSLHYHLVIPNMSTSSGFFSLGMSDDKITVLWSIRGTRTFTEKVFWRYMGIEKDLVKKMQKGLANIRAQVEKK